MKFEKEIFAESGWGSICATGRYVEVSANSHDGGADLLLTPGQAQRLARQLLLFAEAAAEHEHEAEGSEDASSSALEGPSEAYFRAKGYPGVKCVLPWEYPPRA